MVPPYRLPRWGGQAATDLTALVLRRDFDASLGYTPCHWCGGRATTADHWPVGRDEGGSDLPDNLVPACAPCNFRRGAQYVNRRKRPNGGRPSRDW